MFKPNNLKKVFFHTFFILISFLMIISLTNSSELVESLETNSAYLGNCSEITKDRDDKIKIKRMLEALVIKNSTLQINTPPGRRSIRERLQNNLRKIEWKIFSTNKEIKKITEYAIKKGCPLNSLAEADFSKEAVSFKIGELRQVPQPSITDGLLKFAYQRGSYESSLGVGENIDETQVELILSRMIFKIIEIKGKVSYDRAKIPSSEYDVLTTNNRYSFLLDFTYNTPYIGNTRNYIFGSLGIGYGILKTSYSTGTYIVMPGFVVGVVIPLFRKINFTGKGGLQFIQLDESVTKNLSVRDVFESSSNKIVKSLEGGTSYEKNIVDGAISLGLNYIEPFSIHRGSMFLFEVGGEVLFKNEVINTVSYASTVAKGRLGIGWKF